MYDYDENIDWLAVYEKLASNDILHKGTPHEGSIPHSGRYPYGSGLEPYRKEMTFNAKVAQLRDQGIPDAQIAKGFGMSITAMKAKISQNKEEWKNATYSVIKQMIDDGYSINEISDETGLGYQTVISIRNAGEGRASKKLANTKKALEDVLKDGYCVDYGDGVEQFLGVSKERLTQAARLLEQEGYESYSDISFPQATNQSQYTNMRVLAPKGMSKADILADMTQIKLPFEYTEDGGMSLEKRRPPVNIDRDRIYVRYAEEGGKDRDGTIEIRRGVPDIDLGMANYAQVRIAVEGDMYMKGMCYYSEDIPKGYDIVYNSKRKKGTPDLKYNEAGKVIDGGVFKPQDKEDKYNPFGSSIKEEDELKLIRTKTYIDKDGKKKQSALNIVSEEGDWEDWSKSLASQFLSKQKPKLAKEQLDKAMKEHIAEYNDIMKIENPYVKEKLLRSFADSCDSDAVHLKAAAMPRQGTFVILPEPSLKENEVFAPRYEQGEELILVRYPHGGIFEIPRLTVNNKNKSARDKVGLDAKDAIAIHPKAAQQLSGADFDGDTAIVIPTRGKDLKTMAPIQELIDFDTDEYYLRPTGKKYKSLTKKTKGQEMGKATNLIADMTIKDAPIEDIVRATKYSMVVIDSAKHDLDYKQAFVDYGIADLKKKYQGGAQKGSSTLITRAKSPDYEIKRRSTNYRIDPETGEKVFYATSKSGKQYQVALGEHAGQYDKRMKSFKMYETNDAYTLSSGTKIENLYADYANGLKDLGNKARLSSIKVDPLPYSKAAADVYKTEVDSLKLKLTQSKMNAPLERQANLIANKEAQIKLDAKGDYDKDDEKKIRNQAIKETRTRLGAKHYDFTIDAAEWEALNAGAVNKSTQQEIFKKVDDEKLKQQAMPKKNKRMSEQQIALAKRLSESGYTMSEIAERIGFSVSAVSDVIK